MKKVKCESCCHDLMVVMGASGTIVSIGQAGMSKSKCVDCETACNAACKADTPNPELMFIRCVNAMKPDLKVIKDIKKILDVLSGKK